MTAPRHILILGAGPGGYVAAIRAAQLGARVSVVEAGALGGVCLNAGCIPSKALLSVVELGEKVRKAADAGLRVDPAVGYDLGRMVERKNQVVSGLTKGIATLFKTWGIAHLQGTGEFVDARTLAVTGADGARTTVAGDAVIIATGSSWPNLPLFPVDGRTIVTSKEALDLTSVPQRLVIVGAGVEGCEFASLFSALGSQVAMVELLPRVLPLEDEEIGAMMARELQKRRVGLHLGTTVDRVVRTEGTVTVSLKNGTSLETDMILVSVGRGFNTRNIGLERIGVAVGRRGEVLVDDHMETNVPGVYAIGDVVGKMMLAHVASAQGKVAADNIMGHSRAINYDVVPAGIFTLPEIGRVGLTEQQAREKLSAEGVAAESGMRIGRFRYSGLGKAQAIGEITGLFKIIADARTGRIFGAHILGAHAADLIHEAAVAMQIGATAGQLADMIHAHPTLAEGLMEAAEDVGGMAIHLARKR